MSAATTSDDAQSPTSDGPVRLRREIYDALAAAKGARTVVAKAALHGTHRSNLFRILAGERVPNLELALKMAADLGVPVEVLFERVEQHQVAATRTNRRRSPSRRAAA